MSQVDVRPVDIGDVTAIQAIYAPIVDATHVSFELTAPSCEEMARRITQTTERLPWLVAVDGDRVVGYAYAAPHGGRAAYAWSVDTSIYLDTAVRGRGVGADLYGAVLDQLRVLGYVSAFAGIALPNAASVALHRRMGFEETGSLPVAGFKLGRWIDVSLWRCELAEPPSEPRLPRHWR